MDTIKVINSMKIKISGNYSTPKTVPLSECALSPVLKDSALDRNSIREEQNQGH